MELNYIENEQFNLEGGKSHGNAGNRSIQTGGFPCVPVVSVCVYSIQKTFQFLFFIDGHPMCELECNIQEFGGHEQLEGVVVVVVVLIIIIILYLSFL